MSIAYILAAMWTLGVIVACLSVLKMALEDGDIVAVVVGVLIGTPMAAVLVGLPWFVLLESDSPDLATLKKNEWACTAQHDQVSMVLVGKVMVPTHTAVCDQYNRKDGE